MKITLGFSPCPNDCFIFDALVNGKLELSGLEIEPVIEDVETLNRLAAAGSLMVTKLSYAAFTQLAMKYYLLNAGSALGTGCGPLLVSKREMTVSEIQAGNLTVAIPGRLTTANFLFSLRFPGAARKEPMLFSSIENAVLKGEVDAGVLIHENRFTYEKRGLKKVIDLGEWWETETAAPIPLGGIVVSRKLPREWALKIDDLIRSSVRRAFSDPDGAMPFIKKHAQEMDENVMKQHIALYVNEYSIDLGPAGRRAVEILFRKAKESGQIRDIPADYLLS
ncbi:MAG: 1,4-dihydroxy-6-naphthoate synthase [Bacteroidia bacterium]|nr:1,4-dihydroxy-6-naphthoate synthase [Bacteroidia bacterium]